MIDLIDQHFEKVKNRNNDFWQIFQISQYGLKSDSATSTNLFFGFLSKNKPKPTILGKLQENIFWRFSWVLTHDFWAFWARKLKIFVRPQKHPKRVCSHFGGPRSTLGAFLGNRRHFWNFEIFVIKCLKYVLFPYDRSQWPKFRKSRKSRFWEGHT